MRRFYRVLERLKKRIKTDFPVLVYIVDPNKIKGYWGLTTFTGKRYVIRIAKADVNVMTLILTHEYSHCIGDWTSEGDDCHDENWARNYSLCWKAYTGE